LMGGEVSVASEHGRGSTFSAKIPMPYVASLGDNPPFSKVNQRSQQPQVVVLDSRSFVRRFIEHHNKQWKLETIFAESPEATENVISAKTLAIFANLEEMPLEVFKEFKAKCSQKFPEATFVIVQSAEILPSEEVPAGVSVMMQPLSFLHLYSILTKTTMHISPQEEEAEQSDIGQLSLLMAEDNKINQMIAQTFLKGLGHKVKIVDNGDLAVKAAGEEVFDCILMDIMMPVMDGITATINIRSNEQTSGKPSTPIVALTAAGESSLRDECISNGMDDCLFKPFRKQDLQKMLVKVVKESRARNNTNNN